MLSIVNRFFQEGKGKALKDRIDSSMALKFMLSVTAVICAFLSIGAILIILMLMREQYQALEAHGQDRGDFLSKVVAEPFLRQDIAALDSIASDVIKARDVLYTYVTNASNRIQNTPDAIFNRSHVEVRDLLAKEQTADVEALVARMNEQLDPIMIQSDIRLEGARIGSVRMGFSRAVIRRIAWESFWKLVGIGVFIIGGLALMMYIVVRKVIVNNTAEVVAAASSIATGDLSQRVKVRSTDELGKLGRELNRMVFGLKGMIDNVRNAARNTEAVWKEVKGTAQEITGGSKVQADAVEEVASSVNEMHFSLKEMAGNVEGLSTTSETTSSSVIEMAASSDEVAKTIVHLSTAIEDTSTAILEMSAAVRQIADSVEVLSSAAEDTAASATEISASVKEVEANAQQSAELAEAVASNAKQLGMQSIEKTIEGMTRIESTARRSEEVVNRLGERAENIGSILTVIEDITDQTSLLALNAAILAAQAGEHGKGFAVVAAEIRELANRTAASTSEIGKLITSVQEESREAVGVMREEVSMVTDGVRLARAAGDALEKIMVGADQARDMSRSINKAASEQARGVRQVSDAVDKISDMTRQIARAVNEQKQGSEQITKASEKMRELTRFIRTSTNEQAKASKSISAAVEAMNSKIGMVNRAANEVQAGSDLIVKSIERIKDIARSNADVAAGQNVAMDVMFKQSETLIKEIAKFKT